MKKSWLASFSLWFLMVLFLSNLLLVTLEPRGAAAAGEKGDWKAKWEKTLKAAKKEGKIAVYGPSNRDEQRALLDGFQKAYPEIRLTYISGRMSQLANRIMAERRAGKRMVDILLGSTTTLNRTLKPAGVIVPIRSALLLPEVRDPSVWFRKKLWFGDNEEKYLFLWRGGSSGSFVINTNLAKREEFNTYFDLLNPKWKGKIVAQDPRRPGRGYSANVFFYNAKEYGPKFIKRLFGETDIVLSRDSRQMVDWLGHGKFAIGLFVGSAGEVDRSIRQGLPLAKVAPTKGSISMGTPRAVNLAEGAPHPNAARVYVNWLMSREGQIAYQKATRNNSLRTDIPKDTVEPSEILKDNREYIPQNLEKYEAPARLPLKRIFDEVIR